MADVVLAKEEGSVWGGRLAMKSYRWGLAAVISGLLWLAIGGLTLILLI